MSNLPATKIEAIERALVTGDLSKLTEDQRLSYYKNVCDSLGLNPLTKPFDYLVLNGRMTLYCTKSATEQLRNLHKISLNVTARDKFDDVYVVTAKAKTVDGREDEATGAVNIANLKGDALANAFMKAETKAKRRVTLSICGLGMLDETEVETIAGAKFVNQEPAQLEQEKKINNAIDKGVSSAKEKQTDEELMKSFIVKFGPGKNSTLAQFEAKSGIHGMRDYCNTIRAKAKQENKKIQGDVFEFLFMADMYIAMRQAQSTAPMSPPSEDAQWQDLKPTATYKPVTSTQTTGATGSLNGKGTTPPTTTTDSEFNESEIQETESELDHAFGPRDEEEIPTELQNTKMKPLTKEVKPSATKKPSTAPSVPNMAMSSKPAPSAFESERVKFVTGEKASPAIKSGKLATRDQVTKLIERAADLDCISLFQTYLREINESMISMSEDGLMKARTYLDKVKEGRAQ